jgi:hypothetical protein
METLLLAYQSIIIATLAPMLMAYAICMIVGQKKPANKLAGVWTKYVLLLPVLIAKWIIVAIIKGVYNLFSGKKNRRSSDKSSNDGGNTVIHHHYHGGQQDHNGGSQ